MLGGERAAKEFKYLQLRFFRILGEINEGEKKG
jgi:hypothetical protein